MTTSDKQFHKDRHCVNHHSQAIELLLALPVGLHSLFSFVSVIFPITLPCVVENIKKRVVSQEQKRPR